MSKCFSACNRGQRNKLDFYQTPYSITEQLLENEKFAMLLPLNYLHGQKRYEEKILKFFQMIGNVYNMVIH